MIKNFFLCAVFWSVSACSDDGKVTPGNKVSDDHVWKEQTQAIGKAKKVEGLLLDAVREQRKMIDKQDQ